ncbi:MULTISPECIES: SMI1/KNR4 family protein [Bacillus cereus group]|uniref:SMI1/KNR4 family protein n=2 Tax=Bacillus TaxID=1386 RepID=UPI000BEE633D|nr:MULTISPECIES: SMI1/KNR4 family protein [Bacillus cereus group]PED87845.1 SMI1/KNR4 family protein [Bacillus cereus]PER53897.1 SMI1/KNR4 family protein [Bacillus cereus]PES08918.1 SMI1/KNR4 family protein [Bacillus cereus]PES31016.1 SMI1/KNR4 family protein [Bacillus cereus]PET76284.1 SMI1/KNR4 family protein [Bacillus cereus]
MWKTFISNVSTDFQFKVPATKDEISQIKEKLNVELPNDLSSLLNETNGVFDEYDCLFIWSIEQILKENLNLRSFNDFKDLYMPFDCLLFFADGGNGDLFGYAILNGAIQKDDVYVWNHENDSRTWVAPSLKTFIEWWNNGTITV